MIPAACGHSWTELSPWIEERDVDGAKLRVLGLEGLLLTKEGTRDKDRADAAVIRAAFLASYTQANAATGFDLATGTSVTTTEATGICRTLWARAAAGADRVLCTNEDAQAILLLGFGAHPTRISPSAYAQNHGYLAPDGHEAVWLDYRDPGPNGEHGSYDYQFAGEIYEKDLDSGDERRLTFDNPGHPVKKGWPSLRDGIVAWNDWHGEPNENPDYYSGFELVTAPVRWMKLSDGQIHELGPWVMTYPQATPYGMIGIVGKTTTEGDGHVWTRAWLASVAMQ